MQTIQKVREMSDEQIMTEMRKIAAATVEQTTEQSMYYTVMAQRKNVDPKPKIQSAGYGIYEKPFPRGGSEWF
jgi:hypothetical protein